MGFRVVRLLAVFLLFSTGCVESYRTVAPLTYRPALNFYQPGIVMIEIDRAAILLSYPTVTADSIVGADPRSGVLRRAALSKLTRVVTREQYVIDKLVSLRFGSPPVPIDSRYRDAAGFLEITVRR